MAVSNELKHLKPETRAWVRTIRAGWELHEAHGKLLLLAAEAWDRCQQARALLEKEGLTVTSRGTLKAHPAVGIERDSRLAFVRCLRELRLDEGPAGEEFTRPPRAGG